MDSGIKIVVLSGIVKVGALRIASSQVYTVKVVVEEQMSGYSVVQTLTSNVPL